MAEFTLTPALPLVLASQWRVLQAPEGSGALHGRAAWAAGADTASNKAEESAGKTNVWKIQIPNARKSEVDTLIALFDEVAGRGQTLTWTPPGYSAALSFLFAGGLSITQNAPREWAVAVELEEVRL